MNKKVLSFVNKLEGYKTAIKELHWDADNMSQHKLCDDIADRIADFQDAVSEVEQSITGKLATGNLKPVAYKVTSLKKFVEDVLDATNSFYKSIEDEGDSYTGMRSDCESFLSDMQRNLYLVNFTMKEDLKRRLTNRINESYRKEENIKTTFHGTKPSTEKGLFKRINDLTKNGQLNTRVFNGIDDAFEFYNKILGNMGSLQTIEPNDSIHIVKLDTNGGMSYYGLMRTKDEGDGRCKASITFSPHSEEIEEVDPEMSEPTMNDDVDYDIYREGRVTRMSGNELRNLIKESVKIVLREVEEDDLEGQDLYDYIDSLNLNGGSDEEWSLDDWEQPKDEYIANPLDADTVGEYNFAARTKDMDNKTSANVAQYRHPQVSSDYGAKQVLGYDYNSPEGRAWMDKWNRLNKSKYRV